MRSSRRAAFALCAATSLAASLEARADDHRTFVLVHGAFHGGWVWQRVADELRAGGDRVFTPTLTGVGEREHLADPDVVLETHVEDVLNVLEFEDLTDVVLTGHSYAGIVVTAVAARAPERIGKLVYLDAVVPDPGQSFFDAVAYSPSVPTGEWSVPSLPAEAFGITSPTDLALVRRHLTSQPIGTFTSRLDFSWRALDAIPKVFVHCTGDWFGRTSFLAFRAKALARGWDYYDIASGHDAMITGAHDTFRVLARVAHGG